MSLNVSASLIQQAEADRINPDAFVDSIRESLPYAWNIAEKLAHSIHHEGMEWANYAVAPPSEQARGQLLRMVGGDAIRGAVESYFDVKLAFQNCHNLAAFRRDRLDSSVYGEFVSIKAQSGF